MTSQRSSLRLVAYGGQPPSRVGAGSGSHGFSEGQTFTCQHLKPLTTGSQHMFNVFHKPIRSF